MVNISTSCFDHESLCILYSWVLYDFRLKRNQFIFVMVKCGVHFEVRTEFFVYKVLMLTRLIHTPKKTAVRGYLIWLQGVKFSEIHGRMTSLWRQLWQPEVNLREAGNNQRERVDQSSGDMYSGCTSTEVVDVMWWTISVSRTTEELALIRFHPKWACQRIN
jgi:hypothetical protein